MILQLKNYPNLRIESIDGRSQDMFNKYRIINYKTIYSNANVAVICSHLKSIKKAFDDKLDKVFVFEDDADFKLIKY